MDYHGCMEFLIPLTAIVAPFLTALAIVWMALCGPRARAKAEIMKARALAELGMAGSEEDRALNRALMLSQTEQERRIGKMEEELQFLRKLLDAR